jgi:hypothetical protein
MDIVNFDALKAQGKVLPANDVDLTEDYFLIGKRNVHYNTNSFKATEYPIYAIKAGDVIGANTKYKVYTAILNQSGINAPVAVTLLEDTIGDVIWTYNSVGDYTATSALFDLATTACFVTLGNFIFYPTSMAASCNGATSVQLYAYEPTTGLTDHWRGATIEIRVYN